MTVKPSTPRPGPTPIISAPGEILVPRSIADGVAKALSRRSQSADYEGTYAYEAGVLSATLTQVADRLEGATRNAPRCRAKVREIIDFARNAVADSGARNALARAEGRT